MDAKPNPGGLPALQKVDRSGQIQPTESSAEFTA